MSNMQPPPTAPYNNVDYMHNLMKQQQLRQQQLPQQQQPAQQSGGDDMRERDRAWRGGGRARGGGGGGGCKWGRGQKRGRDERWREGENQQPASQHFNSELARGAERAGGREGNGRGNSRGGWQGRGRGRGRGGGGGGAGGQWAGGRVIDDPHYDFETGQIDPSYPTGWDTDCRLVTVVDAFKPTRPQPVQSSGPEAASEEGKEAETVEPPPASSSSPLPSLSWKSYAPTLLGSFTFDTSMTASSPPLRHFPSILHRISTPGEPPVYREPELPLVIPDSQSRGRRQVTKPPLAVLLHVAHRHDKLLSGASLAPPASSSSYAAGLTFVAYRNSLRSVLESREPTWRVDVQRWGDCVLLRRHLDYSWEETEDVGHRFEAACTQSQTDEEDEETDEDRRGFRGLVAGRVGRHTLVTSSEIDAVSAAADCSQLRLSELLELKTAFADLSAAKWREKLKGYWLQSFLGGVQTVTVGLKQRTSSGISIAALRQEAVDGMASEQYKDAQMQKLSALFQLLAERVEQGRLYKLVREQAGPEPGADGEGRTARAGYRTALYEIVGGLEKWPIWRSEHSSSSSSGSPT